MYESFERLLRERGIRASDVAKATGISSSTFTDWKKGRYQPKADKLEKIASYFQVPVWYLQDGDVDHQLDERTANMDMLAFEMYIRNLGWKITRNEKTGKCTLSSNNISVVITSEQFDLFEKRIRNECINGLLGYVAQALNSKYGDGDVVLAAAHKNANPDAGDGDTPENDIDLIKE